MTNVLRAPAISARVDTRATPGFKKGKARRRRRRRSSPSGSRRCRSSSTPRAARAGTRSVLLVLQGLDTSGKGGTVRHVVGQCDPSGLHIATFGRPTAEERKHDFLWRIRRQLPRPGKLGVFDRSHYEDVLAARVRGTVDEANVEPPLRRHQPLRGGARRRRHADRQVLPAHLARGAARAAARAPRRPDQALEVQPARPRGPRAVGRLHGRLRRRARALQHRCTRRGTSCPPTASGTATGRSRSSCCEQLEELGLRWPEPGFDVAEEQRRLREIP